MERLLRWTIVIWALAVVVRMQVVNCDRFYNGEQVLDDEDEDIQSQSQGQINYDLNNDLFDWDNAGGRRLGSWTAIGQLSGPSAGTLDRFSAQQQQQPGAFFKNKRAVFGILGLATKRPHKTIDQINHLPPEDAFLPLRGKKRSIGQVLLPSSSYLLHASYPYGVVLRSRRSLIR